MNIVDGNPPERVEIGEVIDEGHVTAIEPRTLPVDEQALRRAYENVVDTLMKGFFTIES